MTNFDIAYDIGLEELYDKVRMRRVNQKRAPNRPSRGPTDLRPDSPSRLRPDPTKDGTPGHGHTANPHVA